MSEGPKKKTKALRTGRLNRLATMARTGAGTASSLLLGSERGIAKAVDRLGELRGLGTKVGQMAGLVEASLSPDVRARVGPALAKLRDQAARSPYVEVARLIEEELGASPEELFAEFAPEPFASASLGQVHRARDPEGRELAVKVQHPGIREAFTADLSNVTSLGSVATSFIMPRERGREFIDGVRGGFLAELDYEREGRNLERFARLLADDEVLETPRLVSEWSSARVLSTTFLEGVPVERARTFPDATRVRQARAVRRLILSGLADHGVLYADAHAGNFLFREDGSLGVLDFGSVVEFEPDQRAAFADLVAAAAAGEREAFVAAAMRAFGIENRRAGEALASIQWLAIGGLARGEHISAEHVRGITQQAAEAKKIMMRERFSLPWFMPFVARTMLAASALLATLDAPPSGPLQPLASSR